MNTSKVTELKAGYASISRRTPSLVGSKRLLRPNQPLTLWLQWLANAAAVITPLYLLAMQHAGVFETRYRVLAVVSILLMMIVYQGLGVFRRYANVWTDTARLAKAWTAVGALLLLLAMITGTTSTFSRQVVLFWFATALLTQTAVCVAFRCISHVWYANTNTHLPVLVVGSGSLARRLIDSINRNIFLADHVVGVVDDANQLANWPPTPRDVPALGTFDELSDIVAQHAIERVYIALPLDAGGDLTRLHRQLQRQNVDLIWVPDIFALDLLNPGVREISGMPLISLSETPLNSGAWAYLKSLVDVVLASLALVLLSPVMMASAVAIKLTSRGPILYRQTRTGWDGGPFVIWKFRTMYLHDEEPGTLVQAHRNDQRVTPVGRWLRRTSIDELPQLFNVLEGSMSLVGPRPHSVIHGDEYGRQIDAYMNRHRIKPGMTGWAQIHGFRGETATVDQMRRRVEYDVDYINRWSLMLDAWIILCTPFTLFSRQAY